MFGHKNLQRSDISEKAELVYCGNDSVKHFALERAEDNGCESYGERDETSACEAQAQ